MAPAQGAATMWRCLDFSQLAGLAPRPPIPWWKSSTKLKAGVGCIYTIAVLTWDSLFSETLRRIDKQNVGSTQEGDSFPASPCNISQALPRTTSCYLT
jgi:hypothetical protein